MPKVTLGDLTVHYQQMGKGTDLILIHGLYCNLAFWYLTVAPKLAESFRVTVYDLRGHGLTQRMPGGYRAVDLADDLYRLTEHLGIHSAHVVGHSFGGAVALAYSLRHADTVRSLTLADAWIPSLQPVPLGSQSRWRKLQGQLRQHGIEVNDPLPRVAHGFLEELVMMRESEAAGGEAQSESVKALFNTGANSKALSSWRQLVHTTSAVSDFSDSTGLDAEDIRGLRRPTNVIFGRKSRYLATMRRLRSILRDCQVTLVPDAGHYFPVMRPHVFTQAVSHFAAQYEPAERMPPLQLPSAPGILETA